MCWPGWTTNAHRAVFYGASTKGWRNGCGWLGIIVSQIGASCPCCAKRLAVVVRTIKPASAHVRASLAEDVALWPIRASG